MIKFVWCLGHHGSGRFEETDHQREWKCLDCGAVMEKTGIELDQEKDWKLVQGMKMIHKHEPGPWQLGDSEYDPKGFRKIFGGAHGMHNIGQVINRKSRREEDYANALLITAAPELLASLKEVFNQLLWKSPEKRRAEAAINKAQGVIDDPN